MKIFGGHDYYDSAQAFGHDPTVVLQRREAIKVEITTEMPKHSEAWVAIKVPYKRRQRFPYGPGGYEYDNQFTYLGRRYTVTPKEVVFCGKRHVGVKISGEGWGLSANPKAEYFWDRASFESYLAKRGMKADYKSGSFWRRNTENRLFSVRDVSREDYDYLVENRISILIGQSDNRKDYWFFDPAMLKEVMFYRVFDATQAFQQLDMWISGALGKPGNEMVEISDEFKVAKHGFDKHSFRKSKA